MKRTWVSFIIPGTPPSVNHYKARGRTGYYRYDTANSWYATVAAIAHGQTVADKCCNYEVEAVVYLGKRQKGDLDNFAKCLCDSLVHAGVIDTDARVTQLLLVKCRDGEARTAVTVTAVPKGNAVRWAGKQ